MAKDIETFIDGAYQRALTPRTTRLAALLGGSSLERTKQVAVGAVSLLGKSAFETAKLGGRSGGILATTALRSTGLLPDIKDPYDPKQLLEYREHELTLYRKHIMYDERGVAIGTLMFGPWSDAARAVDEYHHGPAYIKPPDELVTDYDITMCQRGIRDIVQRGAIIDALMEDVPPRTLSLDDIETMRIVTI